MSKQSFVSCSRSLTIPSQPPFLLLALPFEQSPYPSFMEKLSSPKLDLGAKKIGDYWSIGIMEQHYKVISFRCIYGVCVCVCVCVCVSHSVMSDSTLPGLSSLPGSSVHGILQARIWSQLPCSSPGYLLTQGFNLGLLHCRQILYHPSPQGSPIYVGGVHKSNTISIMG